MKLLHVEALGRVSCKKNSCQDALSFSFSQSKSSGRKMVGLSESLIHRRTDPGSLKIQLAPCTGVNHMKLPFLCLERPTTPLQYSWASLVAQLVKNPPAMRETWVRSLGWEDPLEKGKATHSSILAWRIPWTVKSMGLQRVRHD